LALDGGSDGLDFYRALAMNSATSLHPGGWLLLEVGDNQATAVIELFTDSNWRIKQVLEDLAGIPRIVIATPPVS
jgi:release factor glutamine methyltransferase